MGANMETIVKRNFEYYQKNVLGRYYIFTTNKNESIIVKPLPENLAHLLGLKYATQNGLFHYSGTRFFNEMNLANNDSLPFISIYDFIDKEKDIKGILSQEEKWCKNKNEIFIELFENLNGGKHNIKIYKNLYKGEFNANYLQVKVLNEYNKTYGYIGIYGDDTDNYFKFNSIISDNGEKNKAGNFINIKNFEIIQAESFDESKYKFMPSPQNKYKCKNKDKKQIFSINKKIANKINRQISPFEIKKGNLNKNNWQLITNKKIIVKEFEKIKKWKSKEEIIEYVETTYKR